LKPEVTIMRNTLSLLVCLALGCGAWACDGGNSANDEDAGPDGSADADTDADSDTDSDEFDPDDPGIHLFLSLGSILMMSQPVEMAIGGFLPTAREDFDEVPAGEEIPLDTCRVYEEVAATPTCEDASDCAPEQECVPDYDDGGAPIPGTEHCATPREPLDLGPFTVEGFATGSIEMSYNAGQSGAYTAPGTDGTLPAGTLVFDTTYTFHGDGSAEHDLGPFTGEIYVAPALELVSPPMVELPMGGMFGIEANPAEELALEWTGENADGELFISLAGGSASGDGGSIECRVSDDGEFTIPAEMVEAAQLGDIAFLNMLTIDRRATGTASGDGLTFRAIDAIQTSLINVIKAQ
jgi:hypothetical protein